MERETHTERLTDRQRVSFVCSSRQICYMNVRKNPRRGRFLKVDSIIATSLAARYIMSRPNRLTKVRFDWVFNAELSPKRYWRGPRSQEVGEEGDFS